MADPLVLAELLAGVEHKIGRFFAPPASAAASAA